jgi:hypothetical protein
MTHAVCLPLLSGSRGLRLRFDVIRDVAAPNFRVVVAAGRQRCPARARPSVRPCQHRTLIKGTTMFSSR